MFKMDYFSKAFSRISTVFSKKFILTLNLIATNPTNPKPDASLLKFLFKVALSKLHRFFQNYVGCKIKFLSIKE